MLLQNQIILFGNSRHDKKEGKYAKWLVTATNLIQQHGDIKLIYFPSQPSPLPFPRAQICTSLQQQQLHTCVCEIFLQAYVRTTTRTETESTTQPEMQEFRRKKTARINKWEYKN